jgi:hypothetical protein
MTYANLSDVAISFLADFFLAMCNGLLWQSRVAHHVFDGLDKLLFPLNPNRPLSPGAQSRGANHGK